MKAYRVGIIGCGKMGTEHGRGYAAHPQTEIAAICETNPENLRAFGERFGVAARYTRYEDLLANEEIDIAGAIGWMERDPRPTESLSFATLLVLSRSPYSFPLSHPISSKGKQR